MIPSQMLKGILEGCILNVILHEEVYGYEITEKLKTMGFGDISEGTIYPLLLRLTRNNYLHATLKPSPSGPQRKYYTLTKEGIEEAFSFQNNWKDLSLAVNYLIRRNEND
ncbi:MAG: PadR family transcriptional regulator [Clostridium sp.]|nr:PadR family transcriptional regulator [Clostridium sp.]